MGFWVTKMILKNTDDEAQKYKLYSIYSKRIELREKTLIAILIFGFTLEIILLSVILEKTKKSKG